MPYKTLASLKKLANLGAEVVAIAPLEGASMVAALSSDPVKVATFAFSGSSSRPTNVSLDEASDVALINKSVAVVKSGDDLWALLDIAHTPKMEQVGRDIRALAACPAGQTALAIGWDGNGAALAFQNNEVGGRQFVLRGDIRAVSLSHDTTYVVVDGAGGGQWRAHAGATPEAGAHQRADLPAGAQGFDLLAGGAELSAISRRGADAVCLVLKEGANALTVKMIQLSAPLADVAVLGTSLFALGQDGRLRLFDGATLAAAADGAAPSATSELDVRASGQPSALAATSKGGAKLWIGTRGGDVIRCEAVKGGLQL